MALPVIQHVPAVPVKRLDKPVLGFASQTEMQAIPDAPDCVFRRDGSSIPGSAQSKLAPTRRLARWSPDEPSNLISSQPLAYNGADLGMTAAEARTPQQPHHSRIPRAQHGPEVL